MCHDAVEFFKSVGAGWKATFHSHLSKHWVSIVKEMYKKNWNFLQNVLFH